MTVEIITPRPKKTLDNTWVAVGISMLTPAGGTDETWRKLHAQEPTAGPIRDPLGEEPGYYYQTKTIKDQNYHLWEARIAGYVPDFRYTRYIKDPKELRRGRPLATQFGMEAGGMALEDSGLYVISEAGTITERDRVYKEDITRDYRVGSLDQSKIKPHQIGVSVGTTIGSGVGLGEAQKILMERGPDRVPGLTAVDLIPDTSASAIEMALGLEGSFLSVGAACASSGMALIAATEKLARHQHLSKGLRAMLVVGLESPIVPVVMAAFTNVTALTRKFNDEPHRASRPGDRDRSGFVMGEGAGGVVVTSARFALQHGLPIYGVIAGAGERRDENRDRSLTNPDGTGINASMRMALEEAGISGSEIKHVNLHGTSTPEGDVTEITEVKKVCGDNVPISSGKGVTNHLLGASAVVEVVECLKAQQEGESAPPNTNLENPAEPANYVMSSGQVKSPKFSLSNSAAFGGQNTSFVITRFEKGNLTEV